MSVKNVDEHNRFRSRTIGFRVSPEEDEKINMVVSLSGMSKQDYIVSKLLDRSIIVKGNCKVHRAVYDRLTQVLGELKRIDGEGGLDSELTANITLITSLIDQLYMKTSI